ncbi:hypothetical protein MK632_17150 [Rhizobium changzhiense]|uniref:glycosyltransferase n=1 Tax=Rhizobium changzhiense TaxID=2692317 RepID=UPI001F0C7BB0|nr:glycosyltransferase [Rhizobium changzhiense]MCH4547473.1 hypothetical protein [Rhizobium changzhiense]
MAKKFAVFTSSDSTYFPLCRLLLQSLKDHFHDEIVPQYYVVDCGLTDDQKNSLQNNFEVNLVEPKHDYGVPEKFFFSKAMTVRAHLPEYAPSADHFIWMDADAYVLNGSLLNVIDQALDEFEVVAVTEAGRSYSSFQRKDEYVPAFNSRPTEVTQSISDYNGQVNRHFFEEDTARYMSGFQNINSGMFGARRDCELWALWKDAVRGALARLESQFWASPRLDFLFEQASFNKVLRLNSIRLGILPETFNWNVDRRLPLVDVENRRLCCPEPPYETINVLHLLGSTKRRYYQPNYFRGPPVETPIVLTYANVLRLLNREDHVPDKVEVEEIWTRF